MSMETQKQIGTISSVGSVAITAILQGVPAQDGKTEKGAPAVGKLGSYVMMPVAGRSVIGSITSVRRADLPGAKAAKDAKEDGQPIRQEIEIQLIGTVRARVPWLHHWIGRLYGLTALIAGLGGLAFIALQGTIGGWPMNLGFSLYGALIVVAAVETVRNAMWRRFDVHRAWAIRLFALVIGSWLYRMDYGFWRMLAHGAGHTPAFDGAFDVVMSFFFYVPNLIVAEAFIRARRLRARPSARIAAALLLSGATAFVALGTYYFTAYHWGPAILKGFV